MNGKLEVWGSNFVSETQKSLLLAISKKMYRDDL